MVEKSQGAAAEGENAAPAATPAPGGAPRRPGHRGMDPRETVAELTAKAHEISQSAGSKVAAAMKEVIGAAAGLTGFAVESARDLIQYMVRRGQMTQIEGDKLLREVEAAHGTRKPPLRADESTRASASRGAMPPVAAPTSKVAPPSPSRAPAKPAAKPAAEPKQAKASDAGPAKATKKSAPAVKTAAAEPAKSAKKKNSEKPAARDKAPAKKAAEKVAAPATPAKAPAKKSVDKGSAKKSAAKGSASRAESPTRSKAASKSAPAKKK